MNVNKPNMIFIFMDDMGWRDLGCSGSDFYETPNIDALCREGMTFDNAYASCPVCSPSRASAMTGRNPARVGITDWIDHHGKYHPCKGELIDAPYLKQLPHSEKTIAQYLKASNYDTWHVGKWHLGEKGHHPQDFGFDVNVAGSFHGHPYQGYFSPYGLDYLPEGPDGEFLTDRITDEAIRLIKNRTNKSFYLNLWEYAVHTPIQGKIKDVEYFTEKAKKLNLDKVNPIVCGEKFSFIQKERCHVERRMFQSNPEYAALIYNLDENIGRLVNTLKEEGIFDNTFIIFCSDNGGLSTAESSPTCNLPAREGKGWTNEGGLRVPMFAVWKDKIQSSTYSHRVITTPDIFCSFLDAAGVSPDAEIQLDGVSFLPTLYGEIQENRKAAFWHYPHYGNQGGKPGAAVRLGEYKLIEFFNDYHIELYNVETDISEQINLSEKMPEKVKELKALLHEWSKDVGAKYPIKP
ncbi:MAG: sulfatase [Eubacteriales bacterium]